MTAGTSMVLTFVWEPLHRDTIPTANPRSHRASHATVQLASLTGVQETLYVVSWGTGRDGRDGSGGVSVRRHAQRQPHNTR
jgi:hypothetical protein